MTASLRPGILNGVAICIEERPEALLGDAIGYIAMHFLTEMLPAEGARHKIFHMLTACGPPDGSRLEA